MVVLLTGVCLILAVLTVTAVTTLGGHQHNKAADEVASLDGHPVTRDELLFHMRRLAPTVQNELRSRYHLQGTFSWNAKTGDRTALQQLETRALDEIWQDKTTLVLAEEQGLVDSVDYADFLAERTEENTARAQAIAAGQTVYGLSEFSPEEYYTHRLTELTTSLKDKLSAGTGAPLRVTDAEVRKAFDADRGDWSAGATTYTYSQLVVRTPDGASAHYATDLQQRVKAAGHLAAVTGVPDARLTTGTYGGSGSTGLNAHDQDLMAVLGKLSTDQVSAPVKGTDQITYYELDDKKVDEDKAFADYSQRIRQSLVEKKFTEYLQRRVDKADTHVDTGAVDAINAKDVQQ
ncbi:hypothetical protein [Peterkaempfera sp. SMS 1(5)a]|uniref:hypothetical protein n=1 Tax=Peterkaempfera podocarpi TaxID=3232308 RepID=UPI0036731366